MRRRPCSRVEVAKDHSLEEVRVAAAVEVAVPRVVHAVAGLIAYGLHFQLEENRARRLGRYLCCAYETRVFAIRVLPLCNVFVYLRSSDEEGDANLGEHLYL